MKLGWIIGLSGLLIGIACPQVQVLWSVEDERGPDNSWLYILGLQVDQAGNVYAATAAEYPYLNFTKDLVLIKYGPDGTRQWMQVWNGGYDNEGRPSSEGPSSLWLDRQGNPVLGGGMTLGQGVYRVVWKYAPDGRLVWERRRPGDGSVRIVLDGQDNILGMSYYHLLKYDPDGTLLWERLLPYPGVGSILLDPQGNLLQVAGGVTKYSPEGSLLWNWVYHSSGWATGVAFDSTSHIYVSGTFRPFGAPSYDAWLVKLSPAGQVIWQTQYSTEWDDDPDLALDERSGAVYLGVNLDRFFDDYQRGPVAWRLLKYRAEDGQLEWDVPIQMPERYVRAVRGVQVDTQGHVYVRGYTARVIEDHEGQYFQTGHRFVLTRFDREGHQHGVYEHPVVFVPYGFLLRDSEVYVSGNWYGGLYLVKLRAVAVRSEGDLNGDGCVADGDLARVLLKFGRTSSQADVNGDGVVNEVDVRIVLENFGLGCGR